MTNRAVAEPTARCKHTPSISRIEAIAAAIPATATRLAEVGYDRGGVLEAIGARRPDLSLIGSEIQRLAPPALAGVDWRTGDGLAAIAPGEVDGVVMAGLGAGTIVAILEARPAVVATLGWLVLCPSHFEDELRPGLARLGWHPADERLVLDRGRFYEVMVARPGPDPLAPDPIAARWGPRLLAACDPLGPAWIADLRQRFQAAFAHGLVKARLGPKLMMIDEVERRLRAQR